MLKQLGHGTAVLPNVLEELFVPFTKIMEPRLILARRCEAMLGAAALTVFSIRVVNLFRTVKIYPYHEVVSLKEVTPFIGNQGSVRLQGIGYCFLTMVLAIFLPLSRLRSFRLLPVC